jgi:hypothetical protein
MSSERELLMPIYEWFTGHELERRELGNAEGSFQLDLLDTTMVARTVEDRGRQWNAEKPYRSWWTKNNLDSVP